MIPEPKKTYMSPSRVIKAAELEIVLDAEEAREAHLKTSSEASDRCEAAKEASRAEGYATGLEEGRKKAMEALGHAISQAHRDIRDLEQDITHIVKRGIEMVLGSLEPADLYSRVVRRAISDLSTPDNLKLWAPERDILLVRDIARTLGERHGLDFLVGTDFQLAPGELILEVGNRHISIGPAAQFERIFEAISRG
jgi:hypothetical protein